MSSLINNSLNKFMMLLDIGDDITGFLAGAWDTATGYILDILRAFCLNVCQLIYPLISFFYQLFITMTKLDIIEDIDIVNGIYQRMTMLLGVIMLFVSIFSLIKLLLDPDRVNDKEKGLGSIFKRLIIVILLMGFTPTIFKIAFDFQKAVLDSNLISKIIISSSQNNYDLSSYGRILESDLFMSFYRENPKVIGDNPCKLYKYVREEIQMEGTLTLALDCVNEKADQKAYSGETIEFYAIDYDHIISVAVGIIMLWILIVYTINVGVRYIQLMYLQAIAPIPIISYLVPKKDGIFNKWVKQVITTYIDIFIRVAVIYFVITLSQVIWAVDLTLNEQITHISSTTGVETWQWMIKVILTISLFLFARRFPQLLQELTGKPSAASVGFGIGGSNTAAGFLLGATSLAAMNFMGSTGAARFTGIAKGLVQGGVAGTAQGNYGQNMDRARQKSRQSNTNDEWLKMQGYTGVRRLGARAVMASGGLPRGLREDYASQIYDNAKALVEDEDDMKDLNAFESTARGQGISTAITAMGDRITGSAGSYVLRDRSGNVLWDETKDGNLNINSFKKIKNREGDIIWKDSSNKGIVAARQRVNYVEHRTRRNIAVPGWFGPRTYSQFKDYSKRHKRNRTRMAPPHGGPQAPRF